MLKKVQVEIVTNTTIKNNTMRKLIKATYKKAAFLSDNTMYEQIDGASIGSPLALVPEK